ncbi:MAG: VanZ family protein [Thermodesulfobacteriota bacterium]
MAIGTRKVDRRGAILSWLTLIAYMSLIFILSSRTTPDILPETLNIDKIIHIAAFGILSALWVRAIESRWTEMDNKRLFITAVILTSLYGISDEVHQSFVPGRISGAYDIVADIIGALLGARLYLRYTERQGE